jgi:hypothetical protein
MTDIDRILADKVAAGRIAAKDAWAVLKFREFLARSGPPRGPWTPAEREFHRHCRTDPVWREFLGLDTP